MQTFLDRLEYQLRTLSTGAYLDGGKSWDITLGTFDCHGQLLFDGVYPCIPGWHHDSVDRDGQVPVYDPRRNPQRHYQFSLLANAHLAPTEFLPCVTATQIELDHSAPGDITKAIVDGGEAAAYSNVSVFLDDNTIYGYSDRVLHRGTPTKGFGWRWFVRAAFHHRNGVQQHRDTPLLNMKRNQVQVYIDKDFKGW
jgi:hypothetical protein